MADSTSAATVVASVPDPDAIARAERFTRERFVHDGEELSVALAPGTGRRQALDAALAELAAGADVPSTHWRRRYSLLLGLERLLSEDEPRLADGTTLNPHQVDALSGTLTALLAEAQRDGDMPAPAAAPVLAVDEDEPDESESEEAELDVDIDIDIDIDDDEDDGEEDDTARAEERDAESWDDEPDEVDPDVGDAPDDPNAHKRFWFEHATGAGKTVAAMGFVEASRTGGVLILTHRRNLVDQFNGELRDRGYAARVRPPLLVGEDTREGDATKLLGPVTVETYQWFVRNAGRISDAYTIVICDEAHTALGEKTSAAIRAWTGPIFIGMTATGALIARHVTDLFPTQTSRFDLAQAARRGVIAPLRSIRIPPGPGVRTIAKVPLRRGDVDVEFDQELLAELLDQLPFNLAIADLYKTRFNGVPGVVYAAGVRHAYNVAEAFRNLGIKAEAVSGETPKRELAEILARYEHGDIDVLVNAQLLAEGWNSPRATVCMHLAPTASKRIYQQRVGRVTRRHPGKEAGVVVDFVHPATKHDDPVVTLHSLLDRDVYRGGAIVVGPVRRGRGRRVRVERRVIPVTADEERRHEVFERELWRIAVEFLDYGEQHMWAALAGARAAPSGWRRARAMLHFDRAGELKRRFLLTAVERNKNSQLRLRALQEIAAAKDAEAFDLSIDIIGTWSRDERREGTKIMLQALAEKRIGRRDQANAWIWRLAEYTRDVHEEYAVQRWPETKRLLGLLVNSSGGAHARNARRLVHAARKHDRRQSAALLAAAVAHTPEAEEVLRGARTRMARKPSALSRELLRNFPKGKGRRSRRRRKKGAEAELEGVPNPTLAAAAAVEAAVAAAKEGTEPDDEFEAGDDAVGPDAGRDGDPPATPSRSRRRRRRGGQRAAEVAADEDAEHRDVTESADAVGDAAAPEPVASGAQGDEEGPAPRARRRRTRRPEAGAVDPDSPAMPPEPAVEAGAPAAEAQLPGPEDQSPDEPAPRRRRIRKAVPTASEDAAPEAPVRRRRAAAPEEAPAVAAAAPTEADAPSEAPAPRRRTTRRAAAADETPAAADAAPAARDGDADADAASEAPAPSRRTTRRPAAAEERPAVADTPPADAATASEAPAPRRRATRRTAAAAAAPGEADAPSSPEAAAPRRRTRKPAAAAAEHAEATSSAEGTDTAAAEPAAPRRRARKTATATDDPTAPAGGDATNGDGAPARRRKAPRATASDPDGGDEASPPKRGRRSPSAKATPDAGPPTPAEAA
ncbi:MAG: ribonuclease [Solirubrobacteraceae bacterium]|nr:ribonuclease [Solirubrobacteraceae bacterium]